MKHKIIYGSLIAAFLMISIAFIQPVTARDREPIYEINDTEQDIQNVEQLVEMISNDKQITLILEQIQISTNPDEIYTLLTELETLMMDMDIDPDLIDLLLEKEGTENEIIGKALPDPFGGIQLPWWLLIILAIYFLIIFWPS